MPDDMRAFIERLASAGELVRIQEPVDPLHLSAVITSTDKAVFIENVKGYAIPVVGGIVKDRRKVAIGLEVNPKDLTARIMENLNSPIDPVEVTSAPCQEVVLTGEDVDLSDFPIVFQHVKDGAPYMGSGIQFAKDPEYGPNCGMYRQMYRTRNTTGIDINSPSDLRLYYEKAFKQGKGVPIAVSIGNHPAELLAASYSAPTGFYEMKLAGAFRQAPVQMVKCKTVDLLVPADSEIVWEGEILPTGWTADEGRYSEFHRVAGVIKWNPIVRIKAVTHRKDPIFYSLIMPWEVYGLAAPLREAKLMALLQSVGVRPAAVRATTGGCCLFDVVASLKDARPGEGKTAVLALLASFGNKMVTVVDDDIDIYNDDELRWALSLRMQPAKDIVIVDNVQAKHMDPTVRTWLLPKGQLPVTSKIGIDATIPADIGKGLYEKYKYFLADSLDVSAYIGTKPGK